MDSNQREFSVVITDLTPNELDWWKKEIAKIERLVEGPTADEQDAEDYDEKDWPEVYSPGLIIIEDSCGVVHSEQHGSSFELIIGREQVADSVQEFLIRFRPHAHSSLAWSGGSVSVTAVGQEWDNDGSSYKRCLADCAKKHPENK